MEEEHREGDNMLYMVSLKGLQKQLVIECLYFRPINSSLLNEKHLKFMHESIA